jgi:hypothetical protein
MLAKSYWVALCANFFRKLIRSPWWQQMQRTIWGRKWQEGEATWL